MTTYLMWPYFTVPLEGHIRQVWLYILKSIFFKLFFNPFNYMYYIWSPLLSSHLCLKVTFPWPVIENLIWIEPLLRCHLFYKATFSLSQRWPANLLPLFLCHIWSMATANKAKIRYPQKNQHSIPLTPFYLNK